MINSILVLDGIKSASDFCNQALIIKLTYYVGIIIMVLKIAIPIILIVIGSFELTKAITAQDDDATKKATTALAKKAVIGIAIFLVPSIVGLLMNVIGQDDYKSCTTCLNNALSVSCKDLKKNSTSIRTCEGTGGTKNGNKCECPSDLSVKENQDGSEYCVVKVETVVPNSECTYNIVFYIEPFSLSVGQNWQGAKTSDIQWVKYKDEIISNYTINSLNIKRIAPFNNLESSIDLSEMLSKSGKNKVFISMNITFEKEGKNVTCIKENEDEAFYYVEVK